MKLEEIMGKEMNERQLAYCEIAKKVLALGPIIESQHFQNIELVSKYSSLLDCLKENAYTLCKDK